MRLSHSRDRLRRRAGSALVLCLLTVVGLAALAASLFSSSAGWNGESRRAGQSLQALYLAEAGLSESMAVLEQALRDQVPAPTEIGSALLPITYGKGLLWSTLSAELDGTHAVISTGRVGSETRAISARIGPRGAGDGLAVLAWRELPRE